MQFTRPFGVELEVAGLPRQNPETVLAQAGITARRASYADRDTRGWRIKPDASLRSAPGCAYAFEVVSPILRGQDGVDELRRVLQALEDAGAEINRTCGMHVHVDVSDFDMADFRKLGARWVAYEDVADSVLPPSRRDNNHRYCQTNVRWMADHRERIDAVRDQIDRIKSATMLRRIHREAQPAGRNSKLNFEPYWRQGTVEFRHHSGTVNPAKALAWLEFVVAFTERAKALKQVAKPKKLGTDYNRTKQFMYDLGLDSTSWATLKNRQRHFGFGQVA